LRLPLRERGAHVSEVQPSLWRLLRALYSVWRLRNPDLDTEVVHGLLARLAIQPTHALRRTGSRTPATTTPTASIGPVRRAPTRPSTPSPCSTATAQSTWSGRATSTPSRTTPCPAWPGKPAGRL